MVKKEALYRGKTIEELKELSHKELAPLLTASARRKISRGFTEQEKVFLKNIQKKDRVKTHCRDMLILPEMVGKTVLVHSGKAFEEIMIQTEMIGSTLGEYSLTRKRVGHNAPGIGATRSSANVSVK